MPMRQVQGDEIQGYHLREMFGRGHVVAGPPRTHRPYRASRAGGAYLVLKSQPSRIGLLLNMTRMDLERIVYFERYVVLDPGLTELKGSQLLSEDEYIRAQDQFGAASFTAMIGAEAMCEMLKAIDLEKMAAGLRKEIAELKSNLKPEKLVKRLKLIEAFIKSGNKPEWMMLTHLPVIPPDQRPLVPHHLAKSDLNDLYQRVIKRNNRVKRFIERRVPDIIIHNEKRILQEEVDALFYDGVNKNRRFATPQSLWLLSRLGLSHADLNVSDEGEEGEEETSGWAADGTETSVAQKLSDARNEISNDQILALLSKRGVSPELRRQVAADLIAGRRPRPLWDDREDYEELSHLNAPRFLKAVYPDLFDAEGNLTDEEVVRLRDPSLVQVVQNYMNDRERAGKGPGDAKGITFSRKDNRGRPRATKRRQRHRSPSPA